jgi:hypothetical protein
MPGKSVQLDGKSLAALRLLARDRMMTLQEPPHVQKSDLIGQLRSVESSIKPFEEQFSPGSGN